ncbi:MAG: hypothetical protein MZV63_46590, partial [Marinilabiliales bacterium]|nr:hypothetical protein [Marinilabiliales bacterium]
CTSFSYVLLRLNRRLQTNQPFRDMKELSLFSIIREDQLTAAIILFPPETCIKIRLHRELASSEYYLATGTMMANEVIKILANRGKF